jgi:hypothetical protein
MATKYAIAMKQAVALSRIETSMAEVSNRLDVDRLDLPSITNRDPNLQQAKRFEHLADWCDGLLSRLEENEIDLGDAARVTANRNVVRDVLNVALNNMTRAELDQMLQDRFAIYDFKARVKQEVANKIIFEITGQALALDDIEDENGSDQDAPEAPEVKPGEAKHVTLLCDRCDEEILGMETDMGTAGYYLTDDDPWSKYSEDWEHVLCDDCMHSDPRYKADYPGAETDPVEAVEDEDDEV